jgi:hypothetical protein
MEINIREVITSAFSGVSLGGGASIRQAQVIDNYGEGVTDKEFNDIPLHEITTDWSKVPLEELELNCVAHLDAEGYRYYIPAFMLSVLSHYEPSSMRVIGTLSSLYPKEDMWFYHMERYSLLNEVQREAIAKYISILPQLVQLERYDLIIVERALKNYWYQYLRREIYIQ